MVHPSLKLGTVYTIFFYFIQCDDNIKNLLKDKLYFL